MAIRKCVVAVPARLQSSRLPNKVLADIGGQPMIQRVLERWIIGWPPMSARTLLGSREDCNRAGTATTHLRIAINPRASLHRRER